MKKIELQTPVQVNGVEVRTLTMREMKARDRLVVDKVRGGEFEKELILIANLCEVDRAVIEELEMVDYLELQRAYSDFLS